MSDLQAGAAHISAIRIGRTEWAHRDEGTRSWWVTTSDELRRLGRMLTKGEGDVYSRWCSCSPGTEMPSGWEPPTP